MFGASTGGVKGGLPSAWRFSPGRGRRPYAETPGSRFSRGQPRAHLGMGIARNPMRPFAGGGRKRRSPFKSRRWRPGSALEDMRRASPGAAVLLHEKVPAAPPSKGSLSESVSATRFGNNKKYGFSFFPPFRLSFSHAGEKLKRVTIKVRYIDKTYRFAYLETPMRSEIHAAVPLWINTPLEPPLPSGSPVTERWRSCAEASSPVGGAAGRGNRDHERGRLLRGGEPAPTSAVSGSGCLRTMR